MSKCMASTADVGSTYMRPRRRFMRTWKYFWAVANTVSTSMFK